MADIGNKTLGLISKSVIMPLSYITYLGLFKLTPVISPSPHLPHTPPPHPQSPHLSLCRNWVTLKEVRRGNSTVWGEEGAVGVGPPPRGSGGLGNWCLRGPSPQGLRVECPGLLGWPWALESTSWNLCFPLCRMAHTEGGRKEPY